MKKSLNYRKSTKKIVKGITYLDSNIDTFALSSKPMKTGSTRKDPKDKANAAISQAMYIAKRYKSSQHYNSTVSDIIKETRDSRIVTESKDAPRFSGKHAHSFTFGNDENIKENILKELSRLDNTKTRVKKLKAQLREIEKKIELAKNRPIV